MTRRVGLAVLFGLLSGSIVWVQRADAAPGPGTVSWAGGAPVSGGGGGNGNINGSGTWTANPGWSPTGNVTLVAVPTAGGTPSSNTGNITANPNLWGPVTVSGLATGQYTVYAQIKFTNGTTTTTVTSPTAIINVP